VAAPLAGAVPAVAVQAGRNDGDTGEHAYVAELNGRDEKNARNFTFLLLGIDSMGHKGKFFLLRI
jgi:hypothetical protein